MLAVGRLLIVLFSLFVSTFVYATNSHYAIIIDAGSSGSKLHLFQYEIKNNLPIINDIFSENISPGLSSFANTPQEAGKSLQKLLDDVAQKLQTIGVSTQNVPLSVMATAGMRMLPVAQQRAIYNNVHAFISRQYLFPINTIGTISGKMEGVYGWIDVNYLLKNFDADIDITKGTIDIGGASTEITFATNDASRSYDEVTLTIANKRYLIFSKSFLGMGLDQARDAIKGDANISACYPINYIYSPNALGNFNYDDCGKIYRNLINQKDILAQLIRADNQNFVAFSGAYYANKFFDVDKTPDQAIVEKRIQAICSLNWEQLKANYPTTPEKYLALNCANGTYVTKLIYETYQLSGKQLTITNEVNGKALDWSLGALFYELLTERNSLTK